MSDAHNTTEEISLREALLTFREYFAEIKRSLGVLFLFCLPFVAFQVFKALTTHDTYEAELSFMLNEDSSASSAISGLLGSIGIPFGAPGEENLDKILELSKSRKISQSTFFKNMEINGKSDLLANHVIEMLETRKKWNKKGLLGGDPEFEDLDGFRFSQDSVALFSNLENKALKHLHHHLIGSEKKEINGLLKSNYQEGSGIMYLTAKTFDPEISVALTKNLFDELSDFYIKQAIEKQDFTYQIIKTKTDSIYGELSKKQFQLADFKDRNQGLFARTDQLTEQKLMLDIKKLGAMYEEATKNLEISEFSLKNNTPFIQLIDEPVLPIQAEEYSLLKAIITGLVIGLIFGVAFVVTRKMFRDALA